MSPSIKISSTLRYSELLVQENRKEDDDKSWVFVTYDIAGDI